MATHSSVLAWRIPGTGEPDGLPSMGSHRVGHDWSDLAAAAVVFVTLVFKGTFSGMCVTQSCLTLYDLMALPGSSVHGILQARILEWDGVVVQSHSRAWLFRPHGLQHTRLPCPSPSPRVYSNSCSLSQWCHPTISSSAITFSSCLLSFPASGSFPMSQLFTSGGLSIGASASASVLPMNIQGWFPLALTGLISLQSKGLLRVFSNTTVQKHQFFSPQPSSWSSSHIYTWLLEKS